SALTMPPLYEWLDHRFQFAYETQALSRTAFSNSMRLGKLARMLDSDAVVLRLRGRSLDYLRGAVLDTYNGGRWDRSQGDEPVNFQVTKGALTGPDVTEIRKFDETDRA